VKTRKRIGLALTAAGFVFAGALDSAPTVFISKLKEKYDPLIRTAAFRHGLDPNLVHAVVQAESAYNRWAVSPAGAGGLMQLIPQTAATYGVADVFDVEQNIDGGVRYLKDLQTLYGNEADETARLKKMLAAYNAGQEAVKKYGGIPPYAETRTYINRVLAAYSTSGGRRKTVIVDFWTSDGRHIVTNVMTIAANKNGDTSLISETIRSSR
jgi:soluble lytic murein transglycosylase-like protein